MPSKINQFLRSHLWVAIPIGGIIFATSTTAAYHIIQSIAQKGTTAINREDKNASQAQTDQVDSSQKGSAKKDSKQSTPEKPSTQTNPNATGGTGGNNGSQPANGNGGTTEIKKNCIAQPSACGYPDASTTGYKRTGVSLSTNGITINEEGDFIIEDDNTVIDSKRIDGCVIIRAKNVTIRRSLITNCQAYYNIWLQELPGGGNRDTSNFLMEDVEVDGNRVFTNAALVDDNGRGMTVRRMDMHDVADGPHPGENWLIEDSYIHDMYVCADECHTDSIQSAGAINVTLRHNTILNNPANNGTGGKNAVVRIATEQGPVSGFVVDNNLLDGGNYAVQVRSQGHGAPAGVVVTNNRIVPTWRFAPYDFTGIPLTLSGNYRDDTLEPLNTSM